MRSEIWAILKPIRRLLQLLPNQTTPDNNQGIFRKPLTSAHYWYPGCHLSICSQWRTKFETIGSEMWAILKPTRRLLQLLPNLKTPDNNQGIVGKPWTSAFYWYPGFIWGFVPSEEWNSQNLDRKFGPFSSPPDAFYHHYYDYHGTRRPQMTTSPPEAFSSKTSESISLSCLFTDRIHFFPFRIIMSLCLLEGS